MRIGIKNQLYKDTLSAAHAVHINVYKPKIVSVQDQWGKTQIGKKTRLKTAAK